MPKMTSPLVPEGFEVPWDRAPRQDEVSHIYLSFMGDISKQKEFESKQADLALEAICALDEPTDNWHGFWMSFCTHHRDLPWFAYMVMQYHYSHEDIITDENMLDLVESAWVLCEYPERNLDGGLEAWDMMFNSVGFLSKPEGLERPSEAIALYRGATEDTKCGMAWSSNRAIARFFANRTTYGDLVGRVWTAEVEPDRIYARFETRQEDEYVIDPTDLEIVDLDA